MLQDLEASKPLEYDAFNGIVARLLEASGRAAPINRTFFDLLKFFDKRLHQEAGR
jgi:ketopantoate reductase